MSTKPFQIKAGGTTYGNKLNEKPYVSVGTKTKEQEDFLNNVKDRFDDITATFQTVFDDEEELTLILDGMHILGFDMGCKDDIKNAAALQKAVNSCVDKIQSDTLAGLKDEVEAILDELNTD